VLVAPPGLAKTWFGGLDVVKGTCAERQPCAEVGWLDRYRPQRTDVGVWLTARSFVLRAAEGLGVDGGSGSRRVVRVLARLAVWAVAEGLPLDVEVLLDPQTVERFVAVGLVGDRSRATYRSTLRRVGPRLTSKAPWEPGPASVARRQVAVPYGRGELAGLRADALVQATDGRRRAARALLALGCGSGLDGRWVAQITADDVAWTAWGVLVRVGGPSPRVVPVLAEWESEVAELADTAGDEFLVGGYSVAKNRAGALAASLVVGEGRPRFSASRMRSTWLVSHLSRGTRLPELAKAAGLQGVTVLSDLLGYVPALPEAAATTMLRGGQ
jgi:hypothetical protein